MASSLKPKVRKPNANDRTHSLNLKRAESAEDKRSYVQRFIELERYDPRKDAMGQDALAKFIREEKRLGL